MGIVLYLLHDKGNKHFIIFVDPKGTNHND